MHYQLHTQHKEKRTTFLKILSTDELSMLREKLNAWLRIQEIFCWLDSHYYYNENKWPYHTFDLLIGAGANNIITGNEGDFFAQLSKNIKDEWLLGYLGYDLKNELEDLKSENSDGPDLPVSFFFEPGTILFLKDNILTIEEKNPGETWNQIIKTEVVSETNIDIHLTSRISKNEYIEKVNTIRNHILEGDVYELNFCQEFYAENSTPDPFQIWKDVNRRFPQPFSAFLRIKDKYIISASMERFLRKDGTKVISQPIKGTLHRGNTKEEDSILASHLQENEKERAENIMIVDLVRNDLAKNCFTNSVKVDELCGIYNFPGVMHMISTVSGELKPEIDILEVIKGAFPMGSMTGAPKVRAMQLIEEYEKTKRGVYAGSIGYFNPKGNFDFNVVIRTLVINTERKYLSLQVGSAITYDSDAEKEYQECLLKIKGWQDLLAGKPIT